MSVFGLIVLWNILCLSNWLFVWGSLSVYCSIFSQLFSEIALKFSLIFCMILGGGKFWKPLERPPKIGNAIESGCISGSQTLLKSPKYWVRLYVMLCPYCFLDTSLLYYSPSFYIINMTDGEACEKKSS